MTCLLSMLLPRRPLLLVLLGASLLLLASPPSWANDNRSSAARPVLAVMAVQPQRRALGISLHATGSIHAWQEALIGSEAPGLRLKEVRVNVGDTVRRGQVLAEFAADTLGADLAQAQANVAEAQAAADDAAANARNARALQDTGTLSEQQIRQYLTAERSTAARLAALRAGAQAQQLRVAQTVVRAPDDGIISASQATLGAVMGPGQELFRMIRQGRLEWRAEVAAADLVQLRPGTPVTLWMDGVGTGAAAVPLQGVVRLVAPTVEPGSRRGRVHVDLRQPGAARVGMFARGVFELGNSEALTLPQSAVLLRDGHAYVMRLVSGNRVALTKVQPGRRVGDQIEIRGGLEAGARVVASGGSFLADGDLVRLVERLP